MTLRAPFPYFGGKSRVAHLVWDRFGNVPNYVEPFFGSGAVLLARPWPERNETVNDLDCLLANFWRAVQSDPQETAKYADWPVNEADLHARHRWLVAHKEELLERLKREPDFYDPKVAGWWVWGISQWIGSGWCANPEWTGRTNAGRRARGIQALKRPLLGKGGHGVHSALDLPEKLPALGDYGRGRHAQHFSDLSQQIPHLSRNQGVHSDSLLTRPHLGSSESEWGMGIFSERCSNLYAYFEALQARLRRVRVCCGQWDRILGPSPTTKIGVTGVFLDPPYATEDRDDLYNHDSREVAKDVEAWCIAHGEDRDLRIALCGYDTDYPNLPPTWDCIAWKANGGYANQERERTRGKENAFRERLWFSPFCLKTTLFQAHDFIEVG